ncbi:MAG: AAA family ATPase [Clostridiales bacterium]|nr:AAA family ATPase [Clostridiales bacterium]
MLITRLKLNYFGRFRDKEILLKPGINLIYGPNEAGKSTIHAFIRGMLFGIEKTRGRASSKLDVYSKYLPWDYPGAYGGSMDIRLADKDYRLRRSFLATDKSFNIIDLSTGRKLQLKEGLISELISGLTESVYRNTVSIEQLKARTDAELAAQLQNYIANLSVSKSREIDVGKALGLLKDKRKALMANDYKARLKALQDEIVSCIEKETKMDELSQGLKELLEMEEKLKLEIDAVSSSANNEEAQRMNELPAILEKYKSHKEISEQLMQLSRRRKLLQEQIAFISARTQQISEEGLEKDIRISEELKEEEHHLLAQKQELDGRRAAFRAVLLKGVAFTLLPFFTAAFAVMRMAATLTGAKMIYCLLFGAGVLAYTLFAARQRKKQKRVSDRLAELEARLIKLRSELEAIFTKYNKALFDVNATHNPKGINDAELAASQAEYRPADTEALKQLQRELLKSSYELEGIKEQLSSISLMEDELEDKRDILYETIMRYLQYFIHEDELSDEAIDRLKELIRQKKQAAGEALAGLTARHNNCRLQIERIRWEMLQLEGNEKELMQKQELYDRLMQEQKKAQMELSAVELAIETIEELSKSIHDSFGGRLGRAVSQIVSNITGGRYNKLIINEKLEVAVDWKDELIATERLSAGTIDQIYFSIRLAASDLLLENEELPLILDDSFALYDDDRLRTAISGIADRGQIIILTCHKQEEEAIKELGLPCNIIELSRD